MTDENIVQLFFKRDEEALKICEVRYGKYCHTIAMNILADREDAREIVNDTLMRAWHSIPPEKPTSLLAYLGRIARNLALNRIEKEKRTKRRHTAMLALDELYEVIPDQAAEALDRFVIRDLLNAFLASLDKNERVLFVLRYYYMKPIDELSRELHLTRSNVKIKLYRLRERLKATLIENGITLAGD